MRLPKPRMPHPPEVYAAVIVEHRGNPMVMAQRLEHLGWSLTDAAWEAANWDVALLAATIVHEREKREQPPTDPTPPKPRKNAAAALLTALRDDEQPAKAATAPKPAKKAVVAVAPVRPHSPEPTDEQREAGRLHLGTIKKILDPKKGNEPAPTTAPADDNQFLFPL